MMVGVAARVGRVRDQEQHPTGVQGFDFIDHFRDGPYDIASVIGLINYTKLTMILAAAIGNHSRDGDVSQAWQ